MQDAVGKSVRSDVVIGRFAAEEEIAHAAADQERLMAMALQGFANRIGKFPGIHRMIMRQPPWRWAINETRRRQRGYLVRRTRQVISSDWRVAPTKSSTLFIR